MVQPGKPTSVGSPDPSMQGRFGSFACTCTGSTGAASSLCDLKALMQSRAESTAGAPLSDRRVDCDLHPVPLRLEVAKLRRLARAWSQPQGKRLRDGNQHEPS